MDRKIIIETSRWLCGDDAVKADAALFAKFSAMTGVEIGDSLSAQQTCALVKQLEEMVSFFTEIISLAEEKRGLTIRKALEPCIQ